jgi:hypothetical protein
MDEAQVGPVTVLALVMYRRLAYFLLQRRRRIVVEP